MRWKRDALYSCTKRQNICIVDSSLFWIDDLHEAMDTDDIIKLFSI